MNVSPLNYPSGFHLAAAEGWLALGNPVEAKEELERVATAQRIHPDVLYLRWQIFARLNQWNRCLVIARALAAKAPEDVRGWLALARTYQKRGNIEKACALAMDKAAEFPGSWHLLYDTACYACLLGNMDEAHHYLDLAKTVGDAKTIRRRAAADPDLIGLRTPRKVSA